MNKGQVQETNQRPNYYYYVSAVGAFSVASVASMKPNGRREGGLQGFADRIAGRIAGQPAMTSARRFAGRCQRGFAGKLAL